MSAMAAEIGPLDREGSILPPEFLADPSVPWLNGGNSDRWAIKAAIAAVSGRALTTLAALAGIGVIRRTSSTAILEVSERVRGDRESRSREVGVRARPASMRCGKTGIER